MSKFQLFRMTNSRVFATSGFLFALILAMSWFSDRSPRPTEVTAIDTALPQREAKKRVGNPAFNPLPDRIRAIARAPQATVRTNNSLEQPPAEEEPGITSPDDTEDLDEIRVWARSNPDAASAWLWNAPEGPKHDTVAEMVCAYWAEIDPAQAVALAERLHSGSGTLWESMVHQWARRDADSARDYALDQPPGEARDRLLNRVAYALSRENPVQAARLVSEEISPGALQEEAAISVLHQWAMRDVEAAAEWALGFPDGALRSRALRELENLATGLTVGD